MKIEVTFTWSIGNTSETTTVRLETDTGELRDHIEVMKRAVQGPSCQETPPCVIVDGVVIDERESAR
jgi:hypothetical protein